MKKRRTGYVYLLLILALVGYFFFSTKSKSKEITLSNVSGTDVKLEEVSAVVSSIKISSDRETSITLTDVRTGEKIDLGYLDKDMVKKVKLRKNAWYKVEAKGTVTVSWAQVRKK